MIIETQNLVKTFQVGSEEVQALKGVNLSVNKGEFLSIMGPSGSGKTTLMDLILGLIYFRYKIELSNCHREFVSVFYGRIIEV